MISKILDNKILSVLLVVFLLLVTIFGYKNFVAIKRWFSDKFRKTKKDFDFEASGIKGNTYLVAIEVHDALRGGWFEDERRAVEALKTIPKNKIEQVADRYNAIAGNVMYKDLVKYLSKKEYEEIKYLLI